jgi:hypothetical protein
MLRDSRLAWAVSFVTFGFCAGIAHAQRDLNLETTGRRVALSIGNNAYRRGALKNAVNDARGVGEALRQDGFQTDIVTDASLKQMEDAVNRFAASLKPDDIAVFYYAGHGVQIDGENYLIPTDFSGKDASDLKFGSRSASWIQDKMDQSGARLKIMILDACRTNPFRVSRSFEGGLAQMQGGRGSFVAFATAAGKVADDNPAARHGLFTQHLIDALRAPGLSLDGVFNQVRAEVDRDSEHAQLPYIYSGVIGEFYFRPSAGGAPPTRPPSSGDPEVVYWNSIRDSTNPALFEGYLKRYPNGQFSDIARIRIDELRKSSAPAAPEVRTNPVDSQRYVRIPAGSFRMGCSEGDSECKQDEMPPHQVTITREFWLGDTEVTELAYQKFAHDTGRRMPGADAAAFFEASHNEMCRDHPDSPLCGTVGRCSARPLPGEIPGRP